ncbi:MULTISPECIES: hypothetical protein [Dehalobacter]|jgi:hypothetical protein|uniref:Uncharacterized protein n=1 Tax=Dehalobacter restrictus (strain DSM 9455 / PER-K23) TaxID=871738 RepID=A0ABM5P9L4_DEHRP|nr:MULTISPECIES: hypothetical protein [Dehalobacter]AHF11494.1 hypothetical protein DEHRE_13900 [Dehalobacter restrictus DSM 9455]MDJ0305166.1 hypothetical protein [Dehalobacter sp.]OCZ53884.1 hypothetical protein A7D23_06185 [Dehalobacter sp. TeCB1]
MSWTVEIDKETLMKNVINTSDSRDLVDLAINQNEVPESFSPFCQFFLGPTAAGILNLYTSIPVPDEEICQYVLTELAPHYEKVQAIKSKQGEIRTLIFRQVKPDSAQLMQLLFKNSNLEPTILDLYLDNPAYPDPPTEGSLCYKVNPEMIKPINCPSFDSTWDLLLRCYARERKICLTPYGWTYTDKLRESIAIRYFIKKCDDIILIKNKKNNQIIGIDLILN